MAIIVLVVLISILIFCVFAYDKIKKLAKDVKNAWSALDVQLRFRQDAALNIAAAFAPRAQRFQDLYDKLSFIKAQCQGENHVEQRSSLEKEFVNGFNELSGSLSEEEIKKEIYTEQVHLIEKFEKKIRQSSAHYNNTCRMYNTLIATIPTNLVALMFDFDSKDFFEFEPILTGPAQKEKQQ